MKRSDLRNPYELLWQNDKTEKVSGDQIRWNVDARNAGAAGKGGHS